MKPKTSAFIVGLAIAIGLSIPKYFSGEIIDSSSIWSSVIGGVVGGFVYYWVVYFLKKRNKE